MSNIKFLYTTFHNRDDAKSVIKQLINEKLIACANISNNIESIFSWDGEICYENEVSVIIKTANTLLSEVILRLEGLHPYKIPCIAVMDIKTVNTVFAQWIKSSVK